MEAIDTSQPASVGAIASRFQGQSVPTPEADFHAGVAAALSAEREAKEAAAVHRHGYRSQGNDVLTEFERMRRLEAEAQRRAEAEARSNLTRWNGSKALILAYQRARLGLRITDAEAELLASNAEALALSLDFTAEDIERERSLALTVWQGPAHEIEGMGGFASSMHEPAAAESSRGGSGVAVRALPPRPPDHIRSPTSLALEAAASVVQGVASETPLEAEAQRLMELVRAVRVHISTITSIVADAGHALSLADISAAIHARTKHYWGQTWEPLFGTLLSFVRSHLSHGFHHLAQDRFLSIEGMHPLPPQAQPPIHHPAAVTQHPQPPARPMSVQPSSGAMVPYHTEPFAVAQVPVHPHNGQQPQQHWNYQQQQQESQSYYSTQQQVQYTQQQQVQYLQQQHHHHHQHQMYGGGGMSDNWQVPPSAPGGSASGAALSGYSEPRPFDPFEDSSAHVVMAAQHGMQPPQQRQSVVLAPLAQVRGPSTSISSPDDAGLYVVEMPPLLAGRRTTKARMVVETQQIASEGPSRPSSYHTRVPSRTDARVAAPLSSSLVPYGGYTGSDMVSYSSRAPGDESAQLYGMRGGPSSLSSSSGAPSSRQASVAGSRGYGSAGEQLGLGPSYALTTTSTSATSSSVARWVRGGALGAEGMAGRGTAGAALAFNMPSGAAGLSDGDENLSWADFDVLFRPMLEPGFTLTKHPRNAGPGQLRRFWFNASMSRLYWDTSRPLDVLRTGTRFLEIADVTAIVDGVGTDNLREKRARGFLIGSDAKYFSLIMPSRSFDFEAGSINQQKVLVRALAFLVSRAGNPIVRAGKTIVVRPAGGARLAGPGNREGGGARGY